MSYRRRKFPEVLDNLLTSITGGIAAEAHPFPPNEDSKPPYEYSLLRTPVADIVSVFGQRNGQPFVFRKGDDRTPGDYQLADDGKTLQWSSEAQFPDPGSLFQVNYYPKSTQPILTDIFTGSVVRTLSESIALEMARLYAQLEVVYQSGFIDTASGRALDNVVALLGIERVQGGRPAGPVEFSRTPGTRGTITIPVGTRIITLDGEHEYETTEAVTMAQGQNTIRVMARDLELNDLLPADSLTVLTKPIAGVESVTNPTPTTITTQNETDAELRTRTKNFLHGSERATLGAIRQAITKQGITVDVSEPENTPGYVDYSVIGEAPSPEQQRRLDRAIEETRPAGVIVRAQGVQQPHSVNLSLLLTTTSGLLEQDLRAAQRAVGEKIKDYFARLPLKQDGSINRIVGLALEVPAVEDVRIIRVTLNENEETRTDLAGSPPVLDRDAGVITLRNLYTTLGELDIADPNLPTRLNVVVTFPEGETPPDAAAIQNAVIAMVTYLNETNASETVASAKQVLSYGKLLLVIPLPGKEATLGKVLKGHDDGSIPVLPTEADALPYLVVFTITLETGLSRVLSQATDEAYTLTAFERLSVSGVEVQEAS